MGFVLSADVQNGVANSDRLARTVNFNNANYGLAGCGSNLGSRSGQLGPRGGSDRRAVSYAGERGSVIREDIVALCALHGGQDIDGGLTGCGRGGADNEVLEHGLRAMVVDRACLLVEDEAVIDDASLNQPAGYSGRIIVTICYPIGSLSDSSYSFL